MSISDQLTAYILFRFIQPLLCHTKHNFVHLQSLFGFRRATLGDLFSPVFDSITIDLPDDVSSPLILFVSFCTKLSGFANVAVDSL